MCVHEVYLYGYVPHIRVHGAEVKCSAAEPFRVRFMRIYMYPHVHYVREILFGTHDRTLVHSLDSESVFFDVYAYRESPRDKGVRHPCARLSVHDYLKARNYRRVLPVVRRENALTISRFERHPNSSSNYDSDVRGDFISCFFFIFFF